MPADASAIAIPNAVLQSFLFVLARVAGALSFVSMPGFKNAPVAPKVVLILAVTVALLPVWPTQTIAQAGVDLSRPPIGWLLAEVAFGVTAGVLLSWLVEGFVLAMQVLGLQAGYAYASTIDPTTQADSSTLQVVAQLAASLLFVAFGLHREVLRAFAASIEVFPPGSYRVDGAIAQTVIRFCGSMFELAVRLALPLVSLLVLVDVALALLGRINASLQLLTLAFPAKMLTSMAVLGILMGVWPSLFEKQAGEALGVLWGILGRTP